MKKRVVQWMIIGCVACLASLTSCKKYIDLTPKDATYDQVFWANGSNVEKALAGAYGLLRDGLRQDRSYFIFGDIPADEFWLDAGVFWNYQSVIRDGKFKYSYAPYLEPSVKNWTRFYGIINQCHLIVENTAKIPESKFNGGAAGKNQLLGEGYFLRAFTYFYITRIWGDPIVTKESLKDPTNVPPVARSSESDALDYCIEDLKQASALMGYGDDKSRADKGAALALLAQVYAWKHDYANSLIYCDSVINSGQYGLEDIADYGNIWKGNSQESIFELNMLYSATGVSESSSSFFGDFLAAPFVKEKESYQSWVVNEDNTADLFTDPADQRYDKIFAPSSDGALLLVKYANVNYYDANRPTTYAVSNNLVLSRLADIYLLKAEAALATSALGEAIDAVDAVRERAGLDDVGSLTMDDIADERRRELYGEGIVGFDLIRMGQLLRLFNDAYTQDRINAKGYYWPLDMRTLLPQDALLTQNLWWKNH